MHCYPFLTAAPINSFYSSVPFPGRSVLENGCEARRGHSSSFVQVCPIFSSSASLFLSLALLSLCLSFLPPLPLPLFHSSIVQHLFDHEFFILRHFDPNESGSVHYGEFVWAFFNRRYVQTVLDHSFYAVISCQ